MLAPDLIATDRLRPEDVPLFEQMCLAYSFAAEAAELLAEEITIKDRAHGNVLRKHPAWQMWRDSVGVLRQIACEYGGTPASRSRLELSIATDDPEDPWTKF